MARSSLRFRRVVKSTNRSCYPGTERLRSPTRAFTLVELMIVVVIVGVLAVIATVGFRKLVGSAHTTEATQMVQSIRVAQEAFHAETGSYDDVSKQLCTSVTCPAFYPLVAAGGGQTVGNFKSPWGIACGTTACNAGTDWLQLPVHMNGSVLYGYSTIAGVAGVATGMTTGSSVPSTIGSLTVTMPTPTSDWYVITAVGDEDGDGSPCIVLGSSLSTDLAVSGEGN